MRRRRDITLLYVGFLLAKGRGVSPFLIRDPRGSTVTEEGGEEGLRGKRQTPNQPYGRQPPMWTPN